MLPLSGDSMVVGWFTAEQDPAVMQQILLGGGQDADFEELARHLGSEAVKDHGSAARTSYALAMVSRGRQKEEKLKYLALAVQSFDQIPKTSAERGAFVRIYVDR